MKVVFAYADDWEGLYVDGILRCEGHSIQIEYALKAVGVVMESIRPDQEWLEENGSLPVNLSDVKTAE